MRRTFPNWLVTDEARLGQVRAAPPALLSAPPVVGVDSSKRPAQPQPDSETTGRKALLRDDLTTHSPEVVRRDLRARGRPSADPARRRGEEHRRATRASAKQRGAMWCVLLGLWRGLRGVSF